MEVRKHESLNEKVSIEDVRAGDVFEYEGKYLLRCNDSAWDRLDCNDTVETVVTHFNRPSNVCLIAVDLADGKIHIFDHSRRYYPVKVLLVGSHCEVYKKNNP